MTASSIDTRQPFSIQIIDSLSPHGLEYFNNQGPFNLAKNTEQPHAIILRSTNLHDYMFPDSVEILGRAGAGTNNIPVDTLTSRGIPVLNTPGANANAVKELALAGLLLSSRKICSAWEYVQSLPNNDQLSTTIEANKKQFESRGFKVKKNIKEKIVEVVKPKKKKNVKKTKKSSKKNVE